MNSRQLKRTFLYLARAVGGFRLSYYATRHRLRILCYHGFSIGDEYKSLPGMFMRAETFRRRMDVLDRLGAPVVSLDEAVDRLKSHQITNGEVVITLDDGWASNLTIAHPILKAHRFPATIYVTTEHLANGTEVFNMVLAYLMRTSTRDSIELSGINPQLDGSYALRPDPGPANRKLVQAAEKYLSLGERQAVLGKIAAAFGVNLAIVLERDRFRLLTADEIRRLDRDGISIELHSHTHHLPKDDFEATRKEIVQNRDAIKTTTGKHAEHFCYPSGEYGNSHPEWLSSIGIKSATTCDPGLNDSTTNPLLLRRYLDQDDISDIEFEAFVTGFLHVVRRFLK